MLLPFQGFLYMPALGFRIRQQRDFCICQQLIPPYKHEKRERHLSGHSLFNIMYEKKISYSQGEVYEL